MQKKVYIKSIIRYCKLVGMIVLILSCSASIMWGQSEMDVLKERIQKLESENKDLVEMIKVLKQRLDRLEKSKEDSKPKEDMKKEKKKSKTKEEEKEIGDIEIDRKDEQTQDKKKEKEEDKKKKEDKEEESWLPSKRGESFELGGRLQVEFFEREEDTRFQSAFPENEGGTFHIDEFRLYLDADLKNKIRFHSAYDIEGDEAGIIEAYVEAEELPLSSELMVGLQPRFFRPDRYTESYPITGAAYWHSRDIGLTWKGNYDPASLYFSLLNGVELDSRELGEDESAPILAEDEKSIDMNGNKEMSAGLEFDFDFDDYGDVELMGFGVLGELSDDDILYLQSNIPSYGFSQDDTREFAGANLEYSIGEWDFFSQWITGEDGEIDRTSWYSELSYQWEFEGLRYLNSIRPLVRYGELDVGYPARPYARNGSLTWDRQQWLFGIVSELVDNLNFRFEYMLNEEDTGGPSVDNNEYLFQVEILF